MPLAFYVVALVMALAAVLVHIRNIERKDARREAFFEDTLRSASATSSDVRVGIATLVRSPIELPFWLEHYRRMGVVAFFVRLEDSPNWEAYLRAQPDVLLLETGASQPGTSNYHTLMDRQREFVDKVLAGPARGAVDFVFHLDNDELLEGSFAFLRGLPESVKTLHLENAEAVYDKASTSTACFEAKRFARCSKGEQCRSYANGKAGARPEDGVSFAGPHNFMYRGQVDGPFRREVAFEDLHVRHYEVCTLSAFVEKFYHISKNVKMDDIPFSSYPRSIAAAKAAHDAYSDAALE